MGRKWTEEQKQAQRDRMTAMKAKKAEAKASETPKMEALESSEEWSEERKQAARDAIAERNDASKKAEVSERMRVPIGARRDITAVKDQDPNFKYRFVNDKPGRVEMFKEAGYELVESAKIGDSSVDGTHTESGVVSKDMGKGDTAYLMKQRKDWFLDDQTEKQKIVDESEADMHRDINETKDDGRYGNIK